MLVQSLGWEDPLEEEVTTHSSILAWKIPWTEEPGGLQSMRLQRVRHDWVTNKTLKYIFKDPTETLREKKDNLRYFGSKRNLKRNYKLSKE